MRNTLKFLILVMLTAGLASCELANVDIDTTIGGQLNILTDAAELKSTDAHGFNESVTIDVINEDLEDYEDLIQDFRTERITIRVQAVDSTGVEILAGSEFSISTLTNPGYTWPIPTDWPIEVGVTATLEADSYSVINDMLEGSEPVTFSANGTCNKGDVTITLNYGIEVVVEANPL